MADPLVALREMRRLSQLGGRIGAAIWQRSPFAVFREVLASFSDASERVQPSAFGREAGEFAAALRNAGFADVEVKTHDLTVVLEGGISQALEVGRATSAAAGMRDVPAERQPALRDALIAALQPLLNADGAVVLESVSNIASGRAG
jgi:hypothetical protein